MNRTGGRSRADAGGRPGVDLQPDVERLHRAIRREPRDPVEGREPAPWFFTAAVALALFWGGWYLGRYGGEFGLATHVALGGRDPATVASVSAQTAAAISDPIAAGQRVYANNCASCHQASGQGMPGAFPPVVGSEWVTGRSGNARARILLHGLQGPIEVAGQTYNGAMPAWKDLLKDEEIAAVATYLRQWSPNSAPPVSMEQVSTLRDRHSDRTAMWTADELLEAEADAQPRRRIPTVMRRRVMTSPSIRADPSRMARRDARPGAGDGGGQWQRLREPLTVTALFDDREHVERAVDALYSAGTPRDLVEVVVSRAAAERYYADVGRGLAARGARPSATRASAASSASSRASPSAW
jgi:mono/diheme cytochrome c family protein